MPAAGSASPADEEADEAGIVACERKAFEGERPLSSDECGWGRLPVLQIPRCLPNDFDRGAFADGFKGIAIKQGFDLPASCGGSGGEVATRAG